MPIRKTERGFFDYADFKDTYGAQVVVRESSSATQDCVWIFVEGGNTAGKNDPNQGAAHLNEEQAKELMLALAEWLGSRRHRRG